MKKRNMVLVVIGVILVLCLAIKGDGKSEEERAAEEKAHQEMTAFIQEKIGLEEKAADKMAGMLEDCGITALTELTHAPGRDNYCGLNEIAYIFTDGEGNGGGGAVLPDGTIYRLQNSKMIYYDDGKRINKKLPAPIVNK